MTILTAILICILAASALAVLCVFCVAKPDHAAAYVRKFYRQNWPLANFVLRPSYPAGLRIVGLGGLIVLILWLRAVLSELMTLQR